MSKAAARFNEFSEFRTRYSERFKPNGDFVGFKDIFELGPTLMQQIKTVGNRIEELKSKSKLSEEERRELENHIRIYGDWKKTLIGAQAEAFERIFITVAAARIPKIHFMTLVNEARALWREEGWGDFKPVCWKKVRKLKRKIVNQRKS